jgi:hypothetical protein
MDKSSLAKSASLETGMSPYSFPNEGELPLNPLPKLVGEEFLGLGLGRIAMRGERKGGIYRVRLLYAKKGRNRFKERSSIVFHGAKKENFLPNQGVKVWA